MPGRMIVSLKGFEVLPEEVAIISHPNTVGIILFSRNYKNHEQLKNLVAQIQKISIESNKKDMPIFTDQEGGIIQRFVRGFSAIPSHESFGIAYDLDKNKEDDNTGLVLARLYGKKMAEELSKFGIISLAPVADIKAGSNVIEKYQRAFHSDPYICAKLVEAFVDGMMDADMQATLKHFPGHGQDIGDSHVTLPIDYRPLSIIEELDLIPFKELISLDKVAAIMPAHILYPAIDPDNTAGMSKIWLEDILRKQLGFKGIIVSDCLSMKGAGEGDYLTKTIQALDFGDIALLCNVEPSVFIEVLNSLDSKKYAMDEIILKRYQDWTKGTKEIRYEFSKLDVKLPDENDFSSEGPTGGISNGVTNLRGSLSVVEGNDHDRAVGSNFSILSAFNRFVEKNKWSVILGTALVSTTFGVALSKRFKNA